MASKLKAVNMSDPLARHLVENPGIRSFKGVPRNKWGTNPDGSGRKRGDVVRAFAEVRSYLDHVERRGMQPVLENMTPEANKPQVRELVAAV